MINIRFLPDVSRVRKDGRVKIFIHFTLQGSKTKVSLPLLVEIKQWSQQRQKALPKATRANLLNEELIKYRQLAESLYKPDMELKEFRRIFVNAIGGNQDGESMLLINYIRKYQEAHKYTRSDAHIRAYNSIIYELERFNPSVRIDRFTYSILSDFISFLLDELNLSDNTINTQLARLKSALKYAKLDGVKVDDKLFAFTYKKQEVDRISLSEEDLEKIKNVRLSSIVQQKHRDVLLFACHTGQRHSDRHLLTRQNIKQDGKGRWFLDFTTVKTKNRSIVPLSALALDILKKYNFELPKNNTFATSEGWKKVCYMAGIDEVITTVTYKGGNRIVESKPKWQLVSTHTARRTFATILYNRTKDIKAISKLLGHSSIETTNKYLKIDNEGLFGLFE